MKELIRENDRLENLSEKVQNRLKFIKAQLRRWSTTSSIMTFGSADYTTERDVFIAVQLVRFPSAFPFEFSRPLTLPSAHT